MNTIFYCNVLAHKSIVTKDLVDGTFILRRPWTNRLLAVIVKDDILFLNSSLGCHLLLGGYQFSR